jgi:hypothetical protein
MQLTDIIIRKLCVLCDTDLTLMPVMILYIITYVYRKEAKQEWCLECY